MSSTSRRTPSRIAPATSSGVVVAHDAIVQLGAHGPLQTWHYERAGDAVSVQVRGRLRLATPLAIREAVRGGLGLAWLPEWLVAQDLADGALRQVLSRWTSPEAKTWAVYRIEARGSALIRAFVDSLAKAAPER